MQLTSVIDFYELEDLLKMMRSYFSKWRMNVEEECSIYVPAAHFSKVSFIPTDMIRFIYFVESCD